MASLLLDPTSSSAPAAATDLHDASVVIIGSGPAGYTAAIYLARAGLKPVVLAGMVTPGGSLMTTTDVENYPGFPSGVQGPELMGDLQKQAERFGATVVFDDVVSVELSGDVKLIHTTFGQKYAARAVVLAMGSEHRHLGVPGEQEFAGRGVSSCATCDGFFFRDQNVFVIGGGDSALEEALFLSRLAKNVTIIHRRDTFNASRIVQDRVAATRNIEVKFDTTVVDIMGSSTGVYGATLRDGEGEYEQNTDAVFIAIGHTPRSALVTGQIRTDPDGYVAVAHPSTATNLPGVFAAGDLVDRTYRQAIIAAGSGATAGIDAERYLAGL